MRTWLDGYYCGGSFVFFLSSFSLLVWLFNVSRSMQFSLFHHGSTCSLVDGLAYFDKIPQNKLLSVLHKLKGMYSSLKLLGVWFLIFGFRTN